MGTDARRVDRYVVMGVCVIAASVLYFWESALPYPLAYDDADYMYAGSQGFRANYLDEPSISGVEFLAKGMELYRDPSRRSEFSRYIRGAGDITFYRHFHGPAYFYWLALIHSIGVTDDATLRASGLILHAASCLLILLSFRRLFPGIPAIGGIAATAAFAFNRTAIVTALSVTQHQMVILMTIAVVVLLGLFCRDLKPAYWYGSMSALGLSFCVVETTILTAASLVVVLALMHRRLRERWNFRQLAILGLKGLGALLLTMALVWPKGVFLLGAAKGYAYLAYIAIARKTFQSGGPLDLWFSKFTTAPLEMVVAFAAVLAALLCWKRLPHRWEVLPALAYFLVFLAATFKITVQYTHYHGPMMAAAAIVTGVIMGEMWRNASKTASRICAGIVFTCIAGMAGDYHAEAARAKAIPTFNAHAVKYLRSAKPVTGTILIPFWLNPTLHYYLPSLPTKVYYQEWTPEQIRHAAGEADTAAVLCETSMCALVEQTSRQPIRKDPVAPVSFSEHQSLYALVYRE